MFIWRGGNYNNGNVMVRENFNVYNSKNTIGGCLYFVLAVILYDIENKTINKMIL